MDRLRHVVREIHRRSLWQVLGIYLAASWVAFEVAQTLTEGLGLPEWVPAFALVLLVVGLPIVLATAFVQEGPAVGEADPTRAAASDEALPRPEREATDPKQEEPVARRSLLTWQNAIVGGILAFSLLFGIAGLTVLLRDGRTPLVPEAIHAEEAAPAVAVLPFTVRGEGLELLREGMVDLLSHALDGAAGLRAISNRTVLARWREHVPGDGEADLETALAVARSTGARYALLGSAVRLTGEVRLVGDIYETESGERIASSDVEGDPADLGSLADRLAVATLKSLLAGDGSFPGVDVARVVTESPEALRAYLEGERLMRRFRQREAAEAFRRALEADSAFALAHWRLFEVHTWGETLDLARRREHLEAAHRHRERLTERDALLVEALVAPPREQARLLRSAVTSYPDDATAWYQLGETLIHGPQLLPTVGEIERAFERAIALDPRRPAFYPHAIGVALLYRADSARTAELVARYAELSRPEGPYQPDLDPRAGTFALDLAFGEPAVRERTLAALDTLPPDVPGAVSTYLYDPSHWSTVARLLETSLERATPGELRTRVRRRLAHGRLLYEGRLHEALELMREEAPEIAELPGHLPGLRWPDMLYRARVAGLPVPDSVLDRLIPPPSDGPVTGLRDYLLSAYRAVDRGDREGVRRALRVLGDTLQALEAEGRDEETRTLASRIRLLEAYRALRDGRAGEAIPALEEHNAGAWIHLWWLGQGYFAEGRFEEAARVLGTHGWPETYLAFARDPPVRRMRARALEGLGRDDEAARAYAFFAEHWAGADRELQPLVEEARRKAEALGPPGGAGGG